MAQTKKKQYIEADDQDESQAGFKSLGDLKAFKVLLSFAKPYKWSFALGLVVILSASIFSIISAKIMGEFIEFGLMKKDSAVAYRYAFIFISLELFYIFSQWLGRRVLATKSALTVLDVRKALFKKLQELPLSFYDRQPQGRIVTRITHDVEGIDNFFTQALGRMISALFMASVSIMAMMITDLKTGLILTTLMIPAVIFILSTKNMVKSVNRRMSSNSSATNAKLSEFLNGLSVIRSFGLEKWSKKEYDKVVNIHTTSQLDAYFLYSWSRPLVSLLCSLPLIGLVGYGGSRVLEGTMTVGFFVTFIRYTERFFHPIMMLAREFHVIQQAFTSAERISNFLSEKDEDIELGNDGTITDKSMKGEIEYQDVNMSYVDDIKVLDNLNFKIEAGEMIGFVGSTGCGKTTTVSLLSRLYEFQEGEILLDGISIREYKRNFLRNNIGFVSQDVIIIKASLRDNLCLSAHYSDELILAACRDIGFQKVMTINGINLDSEIFEGGSNLSVGERQLLAFTRITLKDPEILILDEATANIDPAMEEIVHEAVTKVMKGRTCLIIAHRLETLKKCDRILVFEQGKLVEEGSHNQLMDSKGHFFQLHQQGSQGVTIH